jgi:hypothetical protein
MKTGSLRTLGAACGAALLVAAVSAPLSGCASKPVKPRDEVFRKAMADGLGFSGRMLVVDLGQQSRVRVAKDGVRLDGEFLLVEESGHRFNALGRDNLHLAWSYNGLGAPTRGQPVLTATSFLGMTTTELHQVNLAYGHQEGGTVHFDMAPSAGFTATVGTAYVPCWGGSRGEKTLRTLNLATGLEGWGWRTPGDIRGDMAIGGEPPRQSVYFATDDGEVYSLPTTGADGPAPNYNWRHDTHGPVTAGLTVSGEDLFVASQDGFLYCLDRITGGVKWAAPHETPLLEAPVATAGSVYQFRTGGLWCHDRATGAVRWKFKGGARFILEREGKVLVEMLDGTLSELDASGTVVAALGNGGYSYPTNIRDDNLYGVSADGLVLKIEVGGE